MARYTNYQPAETDEIVLYDVALDDEEEENEDTKDGDPPTTTACSSVQSNIFVSIWNFVAGAFSSASLSSGSCHRSPSDDPSA